MTLVDSQFNKQYLITSIDSASYDLQQRFYAMGLCEGNIAVLQHTSLAKDTYSFNVHGNHVALRKREARLINVKEYQKDSAHNHEI
ncbi:ferrous iron transport protein A [Helicobacter aurati]|uniref:Ferrous iron transport protein A n=1 Tax=Helicobacter aurati TaxID=137778 RepID=A0A3D8J428_9HELI|nr:FeoA family protein [Helicobacter aurati]RDU72267.1 ferrous iron transport protein A [Helicobacter aurati]